MKLNRKICWEKWVDPFGADTNNMEWPGAFGTIDSDKKTEIQALEDNGYEYEDDEDDEEEYGYPIKTHRQRPMGILSTPMGIIPITEHTNPTKIFNFWTMHTNFRITRNILKIVNETDGVESFNIFTPYRWRIAIGKAFSTDDVRSALQDNLDATPKEVNKNAKENS